MSSGIDAAATARAAAMTKALRVGRTKGGDGMSVDSGANDDAIDYIGPRCAVIAPNVAPIGLSKPHVGPISPAAPRRDARIPIVLAAASSLAAMSAMPDNSNPARKAQSINGGSPRIAAS